VAKARKHDIKRVVGEYLATPKNGMVKDHYAKLGFAAEGGNRWSLETGSYTDQPVNILLDEATESGSV